MSVYNTLLTLSDSDLLDILIQANTEQAFEKEELRNHFVVKTSDRISLRAEFYAQPEDAKPYWKPVITFEITQSDRVFITTDSGFGLGSIEPIKSLLRKHKIKTIVK